MRMKAFIGSVLIGLISYGVISARTEEAPDYLAVVRAYADAMIEHGRDRYGEEHSPLFAAALDRETMTLNPREESRRAFGAIQGVREHDRSLGGANPYEHRGLYAILYQLTELTGEGRYAEEADKALKHFFTRCQHPRTHLMPWGEHLYWDFHTDNWSASDPSGPLRDTHEISGPWPFWDACYRLAPDASWRFAIAQWDHQVACKETGSFCRHARFSRHGPGRLREFPRYAGQMIENWADSYSRPENADRERRDELPQAIAALVGRMEANMELTETGHLPAGRDRGNHFDIVWPGSNLELARCLWEASTHLEQTHGELAERMRRLALRQDATFFEAPHRITSGGGFVATLDSRTGRPRARCTNLPYTETWATGYGQGIHAGRANQLYIRQEQLQAGHPDKAAKYRKLLLAAAEQYLASEPDPDQLQKPAALASAIQLMLNAHRITDDQRFLQRADHFARIGIDLFLDEGGPLPKATNQHGHYEAKTGGPRFMNALLQLHIAMQE